MNLLLQLPLELPVPDYFSIPLYTKYIQGDTNAITFYYCVNYEAL